ncbi:MAG: PEP-CTERM sorting domain-containing protein [Casimicrobiaceae bacterium]
MNRLRYSTIAMFAGVSALCALPALAALGDSATWNFNLPATATASQNPPYPSVAGLFLIETADGVQFTLTPTWNDPPSGRFGTSSHIERLDYVIDNAGYSALTDFTPTYPSILFNLSFRWDSGAPVKSFEYQTNPNNMDAGYSAADEHLIIDFFSKNNDPEANRFDTTFSNSVWTVLGRNLLDFTGTQATANSKPSPAQGIISVSAYSLEEPKPTPSNWVAGPGVRVQPDNGVPEPGTLLLFALALVGLGIARTRGAHLGS